MFSPNRRQLLQGLGAGLSLLTMPSFLVGCAKQGAPVASAQAPLGQNPFAQWFGVDEALIREVLTEPGALSWRGSPPPSGSATSAPTSVSVVPRWRVSGEAMKVSGWLCTASTSSFTTRGGMGSARPSSTGGRPSRVSTRSA